METMVAYASRTGTRRNLAATHAAGWRQLIAPGQRPTVARGFMLDNGAWSAHMHGERLDAPAFYRHLQTWGRSSDMVVAPDIVQGGLESLEVSLHWLPTCLFNAPRVLIPVQDGMTPAHLERAPLGPRVGLFVGGSTDWKIGTLRAWGELAHRRGAWLHVGRVNTARRIQLCRDAGAHSFDGTCASMYSKKVPLLDGARRQGSLFSVLPVDPAGMSACA